MLRNRSDSERTPSQRAAEAGEAIPDSLDARSTRSLLQDVVDRFIRGELSSPVTVMHLLLLTRDVSSVTTLLAGVDAPAHLVDELRTLLDAHADGCTTITQMLGAGLDSDAAPPSAERSVAATQALFDDSVARSEVASVALYSLGSEAVLARATDEVVDLLAAWGVLDPERDALEIGCGIGRVLPPLSPRLRAIVGVDISEGMLAAARRRTRGLANIRVARSNGRDLAGIADASQDLVLAIDSFPYIVRAGRALCDAIFGEVQRVLRDRGDFIICNYSYQHDRAACAAEVATLAEQNGLVVVRADQTPFRLWDAIAYHLRSAS